MNKLQILNYLKSKVPDYSTRNKANTHLFQFSLFAYPFIYEGKNQWFIDHFVKTLEEIEIYVEGYAKETIDKIASIGKNQPEQIFQVLGEVLVLYNLLLLKETDKFSVEIEPQSRKNGKNPEYRIKINGIWFAIEVKTPDLKTFEEVRHNGLQVTSRLSKQEIKNLKLYRQIIFSKDLKIQDYLKSAEEKFLDYKSSDTYKDDKTLLVILWDDFINEPISTLVNPNSGLLTENSFYKDSKFPNVDGVIVLRHLHHLKHLFYFGELLMYNPQGQPSKNVFNLFSDYEVTQGIYFVNPAGNHNMNFYFGEIVDFYDPMNNPLDFVSEYQPTDFIDWPLSLGVTGLNFCSPELREKIISLFLEDRNIKTFHSNITVDFTSINLKNIIDLDGEEKALEVVEEAILIHETAFRVDKFPKLESDWTVVQKINRDIKKRYYKLKSSRLNENCPCISGKKYYECCYNNLKYYTYTNYYTP
jgi:hypothetical protein